MEKYVWLFPILCWIFTVLFGMVAAVPLRLIDVPLTNALGAGWISLGNIWMLGGLLAATGKMCTASTVCF